MGPLQSELRFGLSELSGLMGAGLLKDAGRYGRSSVTRFAMGRYGVAKQRGAIAGNILKLWGSGAMQYQGEWIRTPQSTKAMLARLGSVGGGLTFGAYASHRMMSRSRLRSQMGY